MPGNALYAGSFQNYMSTKNLAMSLALEPTNPSSFAISFTSVFLIFLFFDVFFAGTLETNMMGTIMSHLGRKKEYKYGHLVFKLVHFSQSCRSLS